MFNVPKTIEEARQYRYRRWGGSPNGSPYREGYCAYEVHDEGRSPLSHQCQRKVKPGKLFCGTHQRRR